MAIVIFPIYFHFQEIFSKNVHDFHLWNGPWLSVNMPITHDISFDGNRHVFSVSYFCY